MNKIAEKVSNEVLEKALEYYDLGFVPIPLEKGSKIPKIKWKKYQTERPSREEIIEWFSPVDRNIALITGDASDGLVCLDFDNMDMYRLFITEQPDIAKSAISSTGRGMHVWVRVEESIPSFQAYYKGEHIGDVKANGGLATVPPSLHEGGTRYEWINGFQDGIAKIQSLSEIGIFSKQKKENRTKFENKIIPVDREGFVGYIELTLANGVEEIRQAQEFNKNNTLFRVACKCFSFFPHYVDYDSVYSRLYFAATAIGLTEYETDRTLQSAAKHVANAPRDIPTIYRDKTVEEIKTMIASRQFFANDDIGNCDRFIYHFGKEFITTVDKEVYHWNGVIWDKINGETELYERVKRLKPIILEEAKYIEDARTRSFYEWWSRKSAERKTRLDVFEDVKNALRADYALFDGNDEIINLRNGIFDLGTFKMIPHHRNALCTKVMNVAYDSSATCPTWDMFVAMIFKNDNDLIHYVQKMCGYFLTASLKEQCVFFFYGIGSNGKSTFINVIVNILGDYYQRINIQSILSQKQANGSAASPDLAKLKGARLVVASETKPGQKFDEALLKDMRGGDSITARHLHKEFITFTPKFKLLLYGNHQPRVIGTDLGIKRTIKMIPFRIIVTDDKKDKDLQEKLLSEKSGILNWMLEGLRAWHREGLGNVPEAVRQETDEYFALNDNVGEFLNECVEIFDQEKYDNLPDKKKYQIPLNMLWFAYERWQQAVGEFQISRLDLTKRLYERGLKQGRADGRYWACMQLKNTPYKDAAEKKMTQMSEALNNDD